jgi:hypothetical protein
MAVREKAVEAVVERVQGRQVSRGKAVLAAAAAGALVYRVLRSGDDGAQHDDGGAARGAADARAPSQDAG